MNQERLHIEVPAEWSAQKAIWTAWPSHPDLWLDNLMPARHEVKAMIMALASVGRVNVLVMGPKALAAAKTALTGSANIKIIPANFGDIWLRDTGPIFVRKDGKTMAATFRFNGWGGKYVLDHDTEVSAFIAKESGVPVLEHKFILEGGSLEHDGAGTILTTRQCLLNVNRQPGGSADVIEKRLKEAFGARCILWLEEGLLNDHTDGHVDNLARFAAPGHVICQSASGSDDPNADVFKSIATQLKDMGLKVTQIPSSGLICNDEEDGGEPVAASHMNYIIYNGVIVLPTYEEVYSKAAAAALAKIFPSHRIVPVVARHVLSGGGSFHCITQQEF